MAGNEALAKARAPSTASQGRVWAGAVAAATMACRGPAPRRRKARCRSTGLSPRMEEQARLVRTAAVGVAEAARARTRTRTALGVAAGVRAAAEAIPDRVEKAVAARSLSSRSMPSSRLITLCSSLLALQEMAETAEAVNWASSLEALEWEAPVGEVPPPPASEDLGVVVVTVATAAEAAADTPLESPILEPSRRAGWSFSQTPSRELRAMAAPMVACLEGLALPASWPSEKRSRPTIAGAWMNDAASRATKSA